MILIADSGSTKTDWCLAEEGREVARFHTQGINPYQQDAVEIARIIRVELCPKLDDSLPESDALRHVHFYGAGCNAAKAPVVSECLAAQFACTEIEVQSDLLGAARALCQHNEGVACILGTGSNSCLYDGCRIAANVSPLGYILGDEGSGAVLGRRLVGDLLKGQMTDELKKDFFDTYALTPADIIDRVYRQPMPNRFLASLSLFLSTRRSVPAVHKLLMESFMDFFRRNVTLYGCPELPVHFIGGVANQYREEVTEAADACGFVIGRICQSPMEGLLRFHREG